MPTDLPKAWKDGMDSLFSESFVSDFPQEEQTRVNGILRSSANPDGMRQRIANTAFLAERFDEPMEKVSRHLGVFQNAFAKQMFHVEQIDDQAFYERAGALLKHEREEKQLITDLAGEAFNRILEAPTPKEKLWPATQAQWAKRPGFDAAHLDLYHGLFDQVYDKVNQQALSYKGPIDAVHRYLVSQQGLAPDAAADLRDGAVHTLAPYVNDPGNLAFITAMASREIEAPKRGQYNIGAALAARFGRGIERFGRDIGEFARGLEVSAAKDYAPGGVYFGQKPVPQWAVDALKSAEDGRPAELASRVLDDAIAGRVSPLRGGKWASEALLGTAEFLPQLAAAMTGPGLALVYAGSAASLRDRYELQGVPADKALHLANITAVPETALMLVTREMVVGHVPGLDVWVKNLQSRIARIGATAGLEAGVIGTAMTAMQVMPAAMQELAASLSETIPHVDWKQELEGMKHAAPETLGLMVPMMLVGTGVATFRNELYGRSFLNNERILRAHGLGDAKIQEILAAPTVEQKEALIMSAQKERTPRSPAAQAAMTGLEDEMAYLRDQATKAVARRAPLETGKKPPPEGMKFAYEQNGVRYFNIPDETYKSGNRTVDIQTLETEGYDVSSLRIPKAGAVAVEPSVEKVATSTAEAPELAGLEAPPAAEVKRNESGGYVVQFPDGKVVGEAATPEVAAKMRTDATETRLDDAAVDKGLVFGDPVDRKFAPKERTAGVGIVAPGGAAVGAVIQAAREVTGEMRTPQKFTGLKRAANEMWGGFQLRLRRSVEEVQAFLDRGWTNPQDREALSVYREAMEEAQRTGRDVDVSLADWRRRAKVASTVTALDRAINFNEGQKADAAAFDALFDPLRDEAVKWGILEKGQRIPFYVPHRPVTPFVGGGQEGIPISGRLRKNFAYAREREAPNFVEGEESGIRYRTKDIAALYLHYASELSKVILAKKLMRDLTTMKMEDGRPIAAVFGQVRTGVEAPGAGEQAIIVKPTARPEETFDYRIADHPAFRKWKFAGEVQGKEVFIEGMIGLHPEAYAELRQIFDVSGIERWFAEPAGPPLMNVKRLAKFFERAQYQVKNALFSYSPFHLVQIALHAGLAHHVNPFADLPSLNTKDPMTGAKLREWVMHGGIIGADHRGMVDLMDGLGARNLIYRVPWIGKLGQDFATWMFQDYIPRIGLKSYIAIDHYNMKLFAPELGRGEITPDDVHYISATQTNTVTGFPNYVDLGRNPTLQHALRIALIAPAFLEERARFVGKAAKGVTGNKGQREMARAFFFLVGSTYIGSRIINAVANDGDPKWDEPFAVVIGNRTYTVRTVPEDVYRMSRDAYRMISGRGRFGFAYNRLTPLLGQGLIDVVSGTNWRGEKVSGWQLFKNIATRWVPMSFRWVPGVADFLESGGRSTTAWWEQALSGSGLQIGRFSPVSEVYSLVNQFKKEKGLARDVGSYPVSKYQQLRYALEDADDEKVEREIAKLAPDRDTSSLIRGFKQSLLSAWTGSKAHDDEFLEWLSPEQRATVEQATTRREMMFDRFLEIADAYEQGRKVVRKSPRDVAAPNTFSLRNR